MESIRLHLSLARLLHRFPVGRGETEGRVLAFFRNTRDDGINGGQKLVEEIQGRDWSVADLIASLEARGIVGWLEEPIEDTREHPYFRQWLKGLNQFLNRHNLPYQLTEPTSEPKKWYEWVDEQFKAMGAPISVVL